MKFSKPFGLSLSKPAKPFDKLRANGYREIEIAEIPLPRHCERSVAIHATVVRDHGSPHFARDDETGMFVISDSLREQI